MELSAIVETSSKLQTLVQNQSGVAFDVRS